MLFSAGEHLTSHWLDLAEGGYASIALDRNAVARLIPLGVAHSSRGKESLACRRPPLRCGPNGCGADRLQLADRHRGRGGRGLENSKEKVTMANIGSFKKVGQEFQGEIVTLSLQTKGVRIVPETDAPTTTRPSHRVYVGRAEIGRPGRSVPARDATTSRSSFDDPSFNAPIYANLFDGRRRESFTLILVPQPQAQRRISRIA